MHKVTNLIAAVLVLAVGPVTGEPLDLHSHWDVRCKSCHGDSADFARRSLKVMDGELVGTHHQRELKTFMGQHYLNDELVAPVTAMLMAQATTTPLFKDQCGGCHGSAADFARKSLELRDGTLVGKTSQRPVADYLRRHGGLMPADVAPMTATLNRVLGEVSSSAPSTR
jgi:mono/diheme cytochrome c family protein